MDKLTMPKTGVLRLPEECSRNLTVESDIYDYKWNLIGIIKGPFEYDIDSERKHGNEIVPAPYETPWKLATPSNCRYGLIYEINNKCDFKHISSDWNYVLHDLSISFSVVFEKHLTGTGAFKYKSEISKYVDGFDFSSFHEIAIIVSCGEVLKSIGLKPKNGLFSSRLRPSVLRTLEEIKISNRTKKAPSNEIFAELIKNWSGINGVYYNGEEDEKAKAKVRIMRKNLSIPSSVKTIFAVYDNTLSGVANEGCVLSDKGVYIKHDDEDVVTIKWSEVDEVRFVPGIFNGDVSFGSKKMNCAIMGNDKDRKKFCAMANFLRNTLINKNGK